MKRSPIRRKAKTPKAWKDADLLARFHAAYPHDELERHLCGDVWEQVKSGWCAKNVPEAHHIFHAGKRVDQWHNLVMASSRAHHYCHRDPVGGQVAAMYAVLIREPWLSMPVWFTEEGMEVNRLAYRSEVRQAWREVLGRDAISGLQSKRDSGAVPECYFDTVVSILEMF